MSECGRVGQELVDYVQNHYRDVMDEGNWNAALADDGGLVWCLSRMRRDGIMLDTTADASCALTPSITEAVKLATLVTHHCGAVTQINKYRGQTGGRIDSCAAKF